jgi:hypothetical protein
MNYEYVWGIGVIAPPFFTSTLDGGLLTSTPRVRWAGHAARMAEKMNAYRILVGKPEGKGSLGRPRRK